MKITIIRSKRKTLALQMKSSEELIVRAPNRLSKKEINDFIDRNNSWINKNVIKMKEQELKLSDIRTISNAELMELVESAKRVISDRVNYYAPVVGVEYGRISIRNQKSKWGSCNSKGNLSFNVALMRAPLEVLDYIVVHELCHRLEMNHSKRFWNEVERVLPNYRESKKWLDEYGPEIMKEVVGI